MHNITNLVIAETKTLIRKYFCKTLKILFNFNGSPGFGDFVGRTI